MTIRSVLLALPVMVAAWLAVLAGISLTTDAAPASVVLFPSTAFMNDLPDGATVLGINRFSVTLASAVPEFAGSLYGKGAMIVLPAGLPGCLPLPRAD